MTRDGANCWPKELLHSFWFSVGPCLPGWSRVRLEETSRGRIIYCKGVILCVKHLLCVERQELPANND